MQLTNKGASREYRTLVGEQGCRGGGVVQFRLRFQIKQSSCDAAVLAGGVGRQNTEMRVGEKTRVFVRVLS